MVRIELQNEIFSNQPTYLLVSSRRILNLVVFMGFIMSSKK